MERNDLFPIEQRVAEWALMDVKITLINKIILENATNKHKNLNCACIGSKKAIDSVPHR